VTGHFFTSTGADTGLIDTETATVFLSTNCQQVTQTIAGHIYDCTGGTATTNEVAGGTLGASGPQTVPTQGNPLNATPVAAGGYTMGATAPSGYQFVICGGTATINSPASATESITVPSGGSGVGIFYVSQIPTTPTAMFAPTQTTCQQFVAGTASTENVINYSLKNGVINNVAPGVLFYYTMVTAPAAGSFTVSVSQSDNGSTPPLGAMQLLTYTANCGTYNNVTASTSATSGTSTFVINGASAGQVFILSVKVDPHSVVGSSTPSPSTVTYTYSTSVNNGPAIPSSIQQALLEP